MAGSIDAWRLENGWILCSGVWKRGQDSHATVFSLWTQRDINEERVIEFLHYGISQDYPGSRATLILRRCMCILCTSTIWWPAFSKKINCISLWCVHLRPAQLVCICITRTLDIWKKLNGIGLLPHSPFENRAVDETASHDQVAHKIGCLYIPLSF